VSKIGIKDIANKSGVSSATVSRALRNPELVSENTRNRVLKAVEETGYKPNRFGASLRTQKSGNVVVVMPDITNQVNAGIIRAIEEEAHKAGYCVLLGDTRSRKDREQHYADMVTSGQADGILIFTPNLPFTLRDDLPVAEQLPPMVNSCEPIDNDEIYKVLIDNQAGAKAAVQHLLDLGHTNIAAVMGPKDTPSSLDRLAGYRKALTDANIEVNENFIIRGDYRTESGIMAMEKLLRLRQRPTAVFCFSDDMAIGAMNTLREYDYRIPEDISVIGFDDISYSKLIYPKLTTIRQPLEDIGRSCMHLLLDQLNGHRPAVKTTILPFELVVRESTGPVQE
jgi:LacI family repressor for deo operon, udp, cdd, tsx, nupC, and nupG